MLRSWMTWTILLTTQDHTSPFSKIKIARTNSYCCDDLMTKGVKTYRLGKYKPCWDRHCSWAHSVWILNLLPPWVTQIERLKSWIFSFPIFLVACSDCLTKNKNKAKNCSSKLNVHAYLLMGLLEKRLLSWGNIIPFLMGFFIYTKGAYSKYLDLKQA